MKECHQELSWLAAGQKQLGDRGSHIQRVQLPLDGHRMAALSLITATPPRDGDPSLPLSVSEPYK